VSVGCFYFVFVTFSFPGWYSPRSSVQRDVARLSLPVSFRPYVPSYSPHTARYTGLPAFRLVFQRKRAYFIACEPSLLSVAIYGYILVILLPPSINLHLLRLQDCCSDRSRAGPPAGFPALRTVFLLSTRVSTAGHIVVNVSIDKGLASFFPSRVRFADGVLIVPLFSMFKMRKPLILNGYSTVTYLTFNFSHNIIHLRSKTNGTAETTDRLPLDPETSAKPSRKSCSAG
jgi:hypothetical protein